MKYIVLKFLNRIITLVITKQAINYEFARISGPVIEKIFYPNSSKLCPKQSSVKQKISFKYYVSAKLTKGLKLGTKRYIPLKNPTY